jgi:hypothetical protein
VLQHLDVEVRRDGCTSSGSTRRTRSYIASRQVQKVVGGVAAPLRKPAMRAGTHANGRWAFPAAPGRRRAARRVLRACLHAGEHAVLIPFEQDFARPAGGQQGVVSEKGGHVAGLFAYDTAMVAHHLVHARLATMRGGRYSLVEDGAMRVEDGRLAWIGRSGRRRATATRKSWMRRARW